MNFFGLRFPTKRSTETPQKIRGKFGAKFGAKSGTKIREHRGTFVLRLRFIRGVLARQFATRINSQNKKTSFHNVPAIRGANRLKKVPSQFLAPRSAIRKTGVQFGNLKTIRENQAIRANPRIDLRKSVHLRCREMLGL